MTICKKQIFSQAFGCSLYQIAYIAKHFNVARDQSKSHECDRFLGTADNKPDVTAQFFRIFVPIGLVRGVANGWDSVGGKYSVLAKQIRPEQRAQQVENVEHDIEEIQFCRRSLEIRNRNALKNLIQNQAESSLFEFQIKMKFPIRIKMIENSC